MKISKNPFIYLTSFLSTLSILQSHADQQACWEPHTSPSPAGTLCWFDDSASGLGWQVGSTSYLSLDGKPPVTVCSKKQDRSVAIPHSVTEFYWLRPEDFQQVENLEFYLNRYEFIAQVPYCSGTREARKSKMPVIPESHQYSHEENEYICRILNENNLIIGMAIDDGDCQDIMEIKYTYRTDSVRIFQRSAPAPFWVEVTDNKNCGWPLRRNEKTGQWIASHFYCKKHRASKAKDAAQELGHRYAAYDDDNNCWTGQKLDPNDCSGKNRVFVNKAIPEWQD